MPIDVTFVSLIRVLAGVGECPQILELFGSKEHNARAINANEGNSLVQMEGGADVLAHMGHDLCPKAT